MHSNLCKAQRAKSWAERERFASASIEWNSTAICSSVRIVRSLSIKNPKQLLDNCFKHHFKIQFYRSLSSSKDGYGNNMNIESLALNLKPPFPIIYLKIIKIVRFAYSAIYMQWIYHYCISGWNLLHNNALGCIIPIIVFGLACDHQRRKFS